MHKNLSFLPLLAHILGYFCWIRSFRPIFGTYRSRESFLDHQRVSLKPLNALYQIIRRPTDFIDRTCTFKMTRALGRFGMEYEGLIKIAPPLKLFQYIYNLAPSTFFPQKNLFRCCRLPLFVYYVNLLQLTRGKNTKLENPYFEALKVIWDQSEHQGRIPGWILTCLDP